MRKFIKIISIAFVLALGVGAVTACDRDEFLRGGTYKEGAKNL